MNVDRHTLFERYPRARSDLRCPECDAPMVLRDSKYGPFYGCSMYFATKCPGSHGAHPDGAPMGTPANQAAKAARIRAHDAFDHMWRGMGMRKNDAYRWMAKAMGLSEDEAHIGMFTIAQCEKLIAAVDDMLARGGVRRG